MAAFRDFDSDEEGPSFKLAGETFACVPFLPWTVMRALVEQRAQAGDTVSTSSFMATEEFFGGVLVPDDVSRFQALLNDRARRVDPKALTEIVNWLMEEYNGRPTSGQSGSPNGRSMTGKRSKAGSSSPVTPTARTA